MDRITKALRKLSSKEREAVVALVTAIVKNNVSELDLKKLKGYQNVFRIRKGNIRIVFTKLKKETRILSIDRRREDTYRL